MKGKYDPALHGDRTLDRLARYIDKNMPENNPDKLDAKQSEAVAQYIYDAFYSLEARLKKQPARIELAHLTNRQYVNTIADILSKFTGGGGGQKITDERGLRGSYYDSRNFASDKKMYERTDRGVNFDFGTTGPEKASTNEFSIQWRGSLIAEETGVYEFTVATALGTRFYLNDDQEPAIDAWVSSAQLMEHKVSMRLIGGRVYPLKLDCFRFKDKTNSIVLSWKPPHGPQQVIPARNLTPARSRETFVIKTAFPADDSSIGYERGVNVSKEWDEAATRAALEVASHVVKNLDRLSDSKAADTNRAAKVEKFCADFVATAFRRPIDDELKKLYVTERLKRAPKLEEAVKRVLLLALKSPRFLYLDTDQNTTDAYEVATRLSYGLWDSVPDSELLKAAEKGELQTPQQVRAQAQRMLKDPRARAKMSYFLAQWLDLDHVEEVSKDPKAFPEFTPEIASDLRASLNIFLEEVIWSEDSDYRRLLLADYLYVNDRLAKFYGYEAPAAKDFVRIQLDPNQRAGVVSHPFLLAAFSYAKASSPIHRGVFLTRNIVGRGLRPPPVAVAFNEAEFDPNLTMREKVVQLTKGQNCMSCHSVINPLGFSLENFDAVGRFRTQENGKTIDTVAEYFTEDGKAVKLSGPRDVAEFAVRNEDAHRAFVTQLFQQVVKQPAIAYGRDMTEQLRQSFVASGFNIQKLLVDIVSVTALHGAEGERKRGLVTSVSADSNL